MKKNQSPLAKFLWAMKRAERKVLIFWIRFSQKHRHSVWLPIGLFCVLFMDGFVMVIPSMLVLVAAVTISPQRWLLYGFIFSAAATLNNAMTYFLGRFLSHHLILDKIKDFKLHELWQSAESALNSYGPWAAFVGAIIGLPTQMITMILGITDAQAQSLNPELRGIFVPVITLAFFGHTVKSIILVLLTRYGWVKLERKIAREEHLPLPKLPEK